MVAAPHGGLAQGFSFLEETYGGGTQHTDLNKGFTRRNVTKIFGEDFGRVRGTATHLYNFAPIVGPNANSIKFFLLIFSYCVFLSIVLLVFRPIDFPIVFSYWFFYCFSYCFFSCCVSYVFPIDLLDIVE